MGFVADLFEFVRQVAGTKLWTHTRRDLFPRLAVAGTSLHTAGAPEIGHQYDSAGRKNYTVHMSMYVLKQETRCS